MLLTILKKDILTELRTGHNLILTLAISSLFSFIISFGVYNAFLQSETILRLFPVFLWMNFLMTSSILAERTFQIDKENSALEGVLLSGMAPYLLFISKSIFLFLILSIGNIFNAFLLIILLNVHLSPMIPKLFIISCMVLIPFSLLSTLLSPISSSSKLGGMFLPLILIPLLTPLLFAALELTSTLLLDNVLDTNSAWFSLLILLSAFYFVLGANLYKFTIME